ncbi:MAG: endonuclease VIII [Dehalococcoidia bacterium]|nr:endonuclease VIII [Dehalococcoidia bacterium]
MIELPEAAVLASQSNDTLRDKHVVRVVAAHSPHKFAWYWSEPQAYNSLLAGNAIGEAVPCGGQVEIAVGDARLVFSEGVDLRYLVAGAIPPDRHQLLIELDDGSHLVGSVQMYGGLMAFPEGQNENKYYLLARAKPSPLTDRFDAAYFDSLFDGSSARLSLKAFLATDQRIPGLGNGVLQDILFNAGMHPKKKVDTLSAADRAVLFESVKDTLAEMVSGGGRDTETDLYGAAGRYQTKVSRNTAGHPCPICGTTIQRESYMGGTIYFCPGCQRP